MAETAFNLLKRANRLVAILVGVLFLLCAGLVLADILLRRLGASLGGTDEISGYVMAIGTAWGMAFGLVELSHVRIDFLRRAIGIPKWRMILDLVSLLALAGTITIVALQCWPVVETTLRNGSRANTPLETPLALVQVPWFAGWIWFALTAWLTFLCALALVYQGNFSRSEQVIGVFPESEAV
ncbi:Tripartite ATP-independent periplasmic transporter, DctQ component [Labrenzia sp. THAF82]|uniref:TRAP transporter small permease subunit n=1 Tax=Labrenzia sp. THAF82 TaxID=2587861 RepID=UPI001267D0C4|nr:TRAP transporter small permease subunit [Labrenzia sp. THAF82]QFT30399.1 Tripartite ATP-independent periplasmic transporter, DctQ component [Labrenzia sp. THAF82]